MNLYWVETEDHHEDWFILAETEGAAERWFDAAEGYDEGASFALLVLEIDVKIVAVEGWPSMDLLRVLGAKIKNETIDGRVIEIGGMTYCEGLLEGEVQKLRGDTPLTGDSSY